MEHSLMKDSGVEWIGEIPENWNTNYLSQIFYQHKKTNSDMNETNLLSLSYGKIVRKDINSSDGLLPESYDSYNIIEPGDIILRLTDLQNDHKSLRVGRATEKGIVTSAYVSLRSKSLADSRYFYYLLHLFDIEKGFYGMGSGVRQGLNFDELKKMKIINPPHVEQTKIADYLDDNDRQIKSLIDNLNKQIESLKEYKKSLIYKCVTKGLDDSVPLKNSGIEWIGQIPEDWRMIPNKYIFNYDGEKVGTNFDQYSLLSLTTSGIKEKNINDTGGKVPTSYEGYQTVKSGQMVFCLFDLDVSAVFSGISKLDGMITSAYDVFTCSGLVNSEYIDYFFQYVFSHRYYKMYSKNIRYTATSEAFLSVKTPVPPLEEQNKIADYLNEECAKADNLINSYQNIIEKLTEYQKSLIYEYVTGKKEVIVEGLR